ncbi:MAG: ankyrin repeat domain-containing protein, partial [Alphaproteobacteria bacterium]
TALHYASSEGIFDLVEYLLNSVKMDVNALDKERQNTLHYALLFLNQDDTNKTMVSRPEHLKIACLLVKHGAKFQDTMLGMQLELEYFEQSLLRLIHNGLKKMDNDHLSKYKNFIQFLTDAQGCYMRFFKDISTELPDGTIYLTRAFKNKEHKIPLAFGWKISDWEFIAAKNKRLIPLTGREIKPMVYDLTEISPLLINQGDTEAEPIVLFYNFESAIQGKLKPTGAKQINIILSQGKIFTPNHYFKQTTNVENSQDAITAIVDLSHEVDRRKKLSKDKLKNELPILCFIDNLSKITNKTAIAELQNIVFAGKDVGVYLIAVARGKLSSVIRANFQSIITFHTATTAESKKYTGCPNATELELDEMLFTSPFADGIQPIHIKMEKM